MKTTKLNCLFLSLLLICSFSLSAQVVVLNNLDEINASANSVGDVSGGGGATDLTIAQEFVTGSLAYIGEPITVTIGVNSSGGSPTFQVDIYDQSGVNPGALMVTLSGDNMPDPGDVTYTGTVTLAASTSYYIVVSAPLSSLYQINYVNSGDIATALEFMAPNQIQSSSQSSPYSWSTSNGGRINFSIQMDNALPVELLGFKGESKEKVNVLEWATVRETNNDYFVIQHSLDGENFDALGTENGRGTNNTLTNYRFYHENPSPGIHYYRLKQMDFDARFEYSEIISLKVQEGEDRFTLYPNPAKDQLTIVNGQGTAFISNFIGQAVQQFNIGENQKTIRIDNLKQGQYFLQILQANGEQLSRIFVKK